MRHPLIIGNWKLNGDKKFTQELITGLHRTIDKSKNISVVVAPPFVYLDQAKKCLTESTIELAAQNVDTHISGAYTGEISIDMLKDIGVRYVIIGHSERRSLHHEDDATIAEKFALVKTAGLIPILCIGETDAENAAGQTEAICARQLDAVLKKADKKADKKDSENAFCNAIIAYEPVWAIGTGKSASPEQAQAVHKFIRQYIAKKNAEIAAGVHILYGGSVNENNAEDLFKQPDIDGALVGGASLKVENFCAIIHAAINAKA